MDIDFSSMSPKALQKLISEATREQKRKKNRAPIAQVRSKLERVAKQEGYSIEELFGGAVAPAEKPAKSTGRRTSKSPLAGKKVPPKYRDPNNHDLTWTGRGHAPVWFSALIDAGKTREELEIK